MADLEIHGFCDEKFAAVREAFARNFDEFGDVGASFAATVEGEFVVDLWAGHADKARTRAWERDTIVNVYSTTKTMSFLCALVLADRGQLDFHAKVTDYWPEYGREWQGEHRSSPFHESCGRRAGLRSSPGDRRGALRLGALHGQPRGAKSRGGSRVRKVAITPLLRATSSASSCARITGRSIGAFFREEIATPLGADFHIGMDDSVFPRVGRDDSGRRACWRRPVRRDGTPPQSRRGYSQVPTQIPLP